MDNLSCVYFYPFLGTGDYQRKRSPTRIFFMLSDSLKLKAPLSIYFLELTKNPWDHTKMVSLDTTPHITVWKHSHFGSLCSEYSAMCLPWIPSIPKVSTSPKYFPSAVTYPVLQLWSLSHELVSFAAWSTLPSYFEQRKFESPVIPCPYSTPPPPPPIHWVVLRLTHIFRLSPLHFWSRKNHFLGQLQVSLCWWQHIYSTDWPGESTWACFLHLFVVSPL